MKIDTLLPRETYEGINEDHLRRRYLAKNILRAGSRWPTMQQDVNMYVKKYDKCQLTMIRI